MGIVILGSGGPYTSTSQGITIPAGTTAIIVSDGGSNHGLGTYYKVNGVDLSSQVSRNDTFSKVAIWLLKNPATGSVTITTDFSASPNSAGWWYYCLAGVDLVNTIRGTPGTMTTTTVATLTSTTVAGDLVIDCIGTRFTQAQTPGAGQTGLGDDTSGRTSWVVATTTSTVTTGTVNDITSYVCIVIEALLVGYPKVIDS